MESKRKITHTEKGSIVIVIIICIKLLLLNYYLSSIFICQKLRKLYIYFEYKCFYTQEIICLFRKFSTLNVRNICNSSINKYL